MGFGLSIGGQMSYIVGTVGRMENVDAFVSAQETIKRLAGDLGATAVRASQTILGGEAQGNVQVAFETETINSAMALGSGMVRSSEVREMMGAAGASVLRRSLMRQMASRGEMHGNFVSGLMLKSDLVSPEQHEANMDHAWKNLAAGANGVSIAQVVATGANPLGTHYFASYCDSLDDFMVVSAKNLADSTSKAIQASSGTVLVGRVLNEVLF